jgi:DNA-binding MarR family transcriptional regulator
MARAEAEIGIEELVQDLLQSTGLLRRRLRMEANRDALSWSQIAVMGRLAREGPATTADLARAEGVKPQSMGATLAALERDGFVARAAHPKDGRQFLYALTDQGRAARDRHQLLKRAWLIQALSDLEPDERTAMVTALGVIRRLGNS